MSFKNSGNFWFCYVVGLCDALAFIVHIVFCIVINLKEKKLSNSPSYNEHIFLKYQCFSSNRQASSDTICKLIWTDIINYILLIWCHHYQSLQMAAILTTLACKIMMKHKLLPRMTNDSCTSGANARHAAIIY